MIKNTLTHIRIDKVYSCGMEFYRSGMYVSPNLTCKTPIEGAYYGVMLGPVCCHNCGITIDDEGVLSQITQLKSQFYVVKPACCSDCAAFITQRKIPVKNLPLKQRGKARKRNKSVAKGAARANKRRKLASAESQPQNVPRLTASNLQGAWLTAMQNYWRSIRKT